LLVAIVAAGFLAAVPPLVRGRHALEKLRAIAAPEVPAPESERERRPRRAMRPAAMDVRVAILGLAPLPGAAEAASLALEAGQAAARRGDIETARALFIAVRESAEELGALPVAGVIRGAGFAVVAARATTLAESLDRRGPDPTL
jgi:hypothetical protein